VGGSLTGKAVALVFLLLGVTPVPLLRKILTRGSSLSPGVASTPPAVLSDHADGMSHGMSKDCKKNFTNPLHFVSGGSTISRLWGGRITGPLKRNLLGP